MASIKIFLRKVIKKDGTSPLAIRITKERKTSYIYLEYSIKAKDWDEKAQRVKSSYPNSARLNNYLIKKLSEATNSSLELETSKDHVTAKAVSQKIKPKTGDTVFNQADLYVNQLKEDGKFKQWANTRSNVGRLKEFLQTDITFSDLTTVTLERFKANLIAKRKVSERTAVNHLVTIRSICANAIKEGACDPKFYPFGKGKTKIKFPDSKKVGLTLAEVNKIEAAELDGKAHHARNLWLISFYFAGIRVSDVLKLKWPDFQDGRLYYAMGKNNKGDSLKVSTKVAAILKEYEPLQEKGCDLVFTELRYVDMRNKFELDRIIDSKVNTIDKLLRNKVAVAAKITKPLSMHISRHTFGSLSGDKIPIQMLQKLYRHSDIKTTIGYQSNFIHKDTDDALEAVIGS